jgi:hypothetical protein
MATDKIENHKFDWGQAVKVSKSAPDRYKIISLGSICAISNIDTETQVSHFDEPIGTILYLIEGPSGEAIEIPEKYLELA